MRSAGTSANDTWLESLLVRRVSHFLSKGPSVSSVDLIFLIYRVEQKMLLFNHLGRDLCILTTRRNSSVQKEGNIRMQNEDGHLESGAGGRLLGHMLFSRLQKKLILRYSHFSSPCSETLRNTILLLKLPRLKDFVVIALVDAEATPGGKEQL